MSGLFKIVLAVKDEMMGAEPSRHLAQLVDQLISHATIAMVVIGNDVLITFVGDVRVRVRTCHIHWVLIAIVSVLNSMDWSEHMIVDHLGCFIIIVQVLGIIKMQLFIVHILRHMVVSVATVSIQDLVLPGAGCLSQIASHGDLWL